MEIFSILTPYLVDLICVITVILLSILTAYIQQRWGAERIKKVKENVEALDGIVEAVVLYVQQTERDMGGFYKFEKAFGSVMQLAKDKGVKVNEAEAMVVIEATVKRLKKIYQDAWVNL